MDTVSSRQQQPIHFISVSTNTYQILHRIGGKYHCVSRDIKVLNPNVRPSRLVLSGSPVVLVIPPSLVLEQHFRMTFPHCLRSAGNTPIQPFERSRLQNENGEPDGSQSYAYCPGFSVEGCITLLLWCQRSGSG